MAPNTKHPKPHNTRKDLFPGHDPFRVGPSGDGIEYPDPKETARPLIEEFKRKVDEIMKSDQPEKPIMDTHSKHPKPQEILEDLFPEHNPFREEPSEYGIVYPDPKETARPLIEEFKRKVDEIMKPDKS